MDQGTYLEHDGRPAVRFERTYPHPIERVWAAVSDPAQLAHWFPASVALQPHAGGAIEFTDDPHTAPSTGTVLVIDPPRRLVYTWGGDELHFTLEPVGAHRCSLVLINVLSDQQAAARNAAGWSVCLAELDKHLTGSETADGPHSHTALEWRPLYDDYVAAGMPAGAAIPTGASPQQ